MLQSQDKPNLTITDREKEFLNLACSDLTYKQIAALMHLSERTIDGYRESLFQKMKVQSRVGLALEAIRRNLVSL
jgi:DNA-binding CsgD family transcriptional regulator